jgi:hypothetical protein
MGFNFGNISSLASLVNMFAGADPVKAQLIPLDENGEEREVLQRAFQYFPENISDSKTANYASKNIPGASHPLYQFINGGDRTISFTAIFTSDEDPSPPGLLAALQGGIDISVSNIAAATGLRQKKHVTNVDSAVIWLRSFLYPRYTSDFQPLGTVAPPPVVRLYLPNSNIHGTTRNGALMLDSIDCIMTQCDVVYESFYRNGTQRITTVSLTFYETIQTGADNWQYANGEILENAWFGIENGVPAYTLRGEKAPEKSGTFGSFVGGLGAIASKLNF